MRTALMITTFLIISFNTLGQSGIRVYTTVDESKFKIALDGVLQNEILTKEIKFDALDPKKPHKITISFSSDTVADIEMDVYLLKNQLREFQILRRSKFERVSTNVGRKIGKLLNIGKHGKDEMLYDIYYLEERTKSSF